MAKILKKRNWAMVLYPESAPENWRQILAETGLQCAISPLHDKDINPDGTPKKAHYHVIMCYSGPTALSVVKKLTDSLNQPNPQALEQVRGYYRYLTHKDNPEKYQYSAAEVSTINGFNITDYVEPTKSEVNALKRDIRAYIRENEIYEYSDLMDMLDTMEDEHGQKMCEIANNNTIHFNSYLKSRRHKKDREI